MITEHSFSSNGSKYLETDATRLRAYYLLQWEPNAEFEYELQQADLPILSTPTYRMYLL